MAAKEYIVIKGYGSISPLGCNRDNITQAYFSGQSGISLQTINNQLTPVGALSTSATEALKVLANENKTYLGLDKSVLMAMYAARQAVKEANWHNADNIGINIGSSRGATGLFEHHLTQFMQTGYVSPVTSPITTLGNLSSWVAHDLEISGPAISHSVTCSTALQALANGFAWLKSGMAQRFLVGGTEAPLTPFTVAQMKAIGIYAPAAESAYYCRPHNQERQNTFVLGEGAAVFALEKLMIDSNNPLREKEVVLEAVGFGFEKIKSKTGISPNGLNFQMAIEQALLQVGSTEPIDLVVMHAPGTVAGDAAELNALKAILGENNLPIISSNKFLIGHTLGASAALSLEYALHILKQQQFLPLPYPNLIRQNSPENIKRILLTAAGFGGNAAAVLIKTI